MLSVAPKQGPDGQLQLHASTVVINDKAVAITGPSGCGKSGFALALMTRGAALLADDITWLTVQDEGLMANCPEPLSGRIEARGLGILEAPAANPAPLHLIVDLGRRETTRLPEPRYVTLAGTDVRVLHTPENAYFVDAVWHYMMSQADERKGT